MSEERFARIEAQLAGLEARVRRLENPMAATSRVQPPPVATPRPTPPPSFQLPTPPPPARPVAPPASAPSPNAEYKIGAQVLPRLGALVLLLGIGFLISLGLSSGWITPAMLFGGAVALCLGFIGVGQWQRETREEFGQVLTAIGSCGLYLTFAGGHVFQKLYSGETLVMLFMLLSFVNLGYGAWRASRSFLAIGVIGGFGAALMPLDRHDYLLNLALHFAILIPSALIAVRHKWLDVTAWLWAASTAALLPSVVAVSFAWEYRVAAFDLSAVICVLAYSFNYRKTSFDALNVAPAAAILIAALTTFGIRWGTDGSVHLLLFSVVLAAVSLLFEEGSDQRRTLLYAALGVSTMLAPFGAQRWIATLILAGFAVVTSGLTLTWKKPVWARLGVVHLVLAFVGYMLAFTPQPPTMEIELTMLGALMAATCILAWAAVRSGGELDGYMSAAAVLCAPMLVRVFQSVLTTPQMGLDLGFAVAASLVLVTLLAALLSVLSGWKSGPVFAVIAGFMGLCLYGMQIAFRPIVFGQELAFLGVAVGLAVWLGTLNGKGISLGIASGVIGTLLTRVGVLLAVHFWGVPAQVSGPMTLLIFAVANSLLGRWRDWPLLQPVSGLAWFISGFWYLAVMVASGNAYAPSVEMLLVSSLLISMVSFTILANHDVDEKEMLPGLAALFGWALFSRLGFLVLTSASIGMQNYPALSLTWIVYAVLLIALGFGYGRKSLRYWSLAVLGATVGKVMLIDLAEASPGIRVGVLMVLGLAMLGGGYWYIRKRHTLSL